MNNRALWLMLVGVAIGLLLGLVLALRGGVEFKGYELFTPAPIVETMTKQCLEGICVYKHTDADGFCYTTMSSRTGYVLSVECFQK